jgi:transposase
MAKLENVSVGRLREAWNEVDDPAGVRRLAPAIVYKEVDEMTQTAAAEMYGFSPAWATTWFDRLERLATEPAVAVLSDEPRSGRPPKLTPDQRRQFRAALHDSPAAVGIDATDWSIRSAQQYLTTELDVEYSERHVRRLLLDLWDDTGPSESDASGPMS